MQKIEMIFKNHGGYAYLRDLKDAGVHTDTIRENLRNGIIEKIKPGLYKWVDMPLLTEQSMISACLAMPQAIICLHSALSYYELTTTLPSEIMIALPFGIKPTKFFYPPVWVFHFKDYLYSLGATTINTDNGSFRVYDAEKTIIDCFRFRRKLGLDVAMEGLKEYLRRSDANINKLTQYAQKARIYAVVTPYIEAMAAR